MSPFTVGLSGLSPFSIGLTTGVAVGVASRPVGVALAVGSRVVGVGGDSPLDALL